MKLCVLLLGAASARASADLSRWDAVIQLNSGDRVQVTRKNAKPMTGLFAGASDTEIVLRFAAS